MNGGRLQLCILEARQNPGYQLSRSCRVCSPAVQLPKGEEAGKELRLRLGDASGASGDQFLTRTGVILLVCERMHLSEQRSASLTRSTVTAGTLLPAKFKQTG